MKNLLANKNQTLSYNFSFEKFFSKITDSLVILKSDEEISRQTVGTLMSNTDSHWEDSLEVDVTEEGSGEEDLDKSLEDYFESHPNTTSEDNQLSILTNVCNPAPCDYLFAGSSLSDQSVGK